ncbi:MAG: site-specific integrase [Odoribacteraceae bacterium]|jgi:integrase|nr:site-specific integrase [Odoribacteraceae bacterium]
MCKNVTVKVKLRPSTVPGQAGTLYYRLTHRRQVRQITTHLHLLPEEWNDIGQCVVPSAKNPALCLMQHKIDGDMELLLRIIRELKSEGSGFVVEDIVARFRSSASHASVLAFMRTQIELLTESNRLGTARNYRKTSCSFAAYLGADVPFTAMTEQLINDYNTYLLRRGILRNTVSFYMRILRSVYNKAVRQRLVEQAFPFREVYTGIDRTRKRAVDEQVISRLARYDLEYSEPLKLARDLFMFSFYARGMAFVDMAYLRKTDVQAGMIRYVRHKTGQQLFIRVEPCMQKIIDSHAAAAQDIPYLFPILKAEGAGEAYAQYEMSLNYYNRQLKKLSLLLGLPERLSSYTSRHSWATAARNHDVPVSVISAGMGHASEGVTRIYLAMLENSVIDNANRRIMAALGVTVSARETARSGRE